MSGNITLTEFKCFTVPCLDKYGHETPAKVVLYVESEWMGLTCLRRVDKPMQHMICALPNDLAGFANVFSRITDPKPMSMDAVVVFIHEDLAREIGYELPAKKES